MDAFSPSFDRSLNGANAATAAELRQCIDDWIYEINTGTPNSVAALYSPDAVLLATFDPKPLTTPDERLHYFVNFKFASKKNLRATLDECYAEALGTDAGAASGLYTFSFEDDEGVHKIVPARFTYVYRKDDGGDWKIISHHSSERPERPVLTRGSTDFKPS